MSGEIKNLANRVAVVSGASSGIGKETAKLLARRGAKVALLARRQEKLDEIVKEIIAQGGQAFAIEVDVTDQASVENAAASVIAKYGRVDLVFNNAGVMLPGAIEDRKINEWEQQIDLNVTGVMRVIHAFIPHLAQAAAEGATVDLINTSSIAAQNIFPYFAVYTATKAYVSHLTRNLRAELGQKNIRVSMIEPGIVTTELQSHVTFQGALDWLEQVEGSMDFLQPEDIAEAVGFLVSQPKHVNIQQITIMPTKQGM